MARRGRRRSSRPLKEATVLIPLSFNDGTAVPRSTILSIFDELYTSFHGWTNEGTVKGAYRMESRKRVEDLLKVTIILSNSRLPELRRMIARWAAALGQEAMLLRVADYRIEFVQPEDNGGRQ